MAFPTIATPALTFERPASFRAAYCRPSGELYQTLGGLSECELMFSMAKETDSVGKNKPYSVTFTAKAKMLQCSLTEIELLDVIAVGTNAWLFQLSDSAAIPAAAAVTEGWVVLSATQADVKPTIVLSGDMKTNAYIQLEWSGSLLLSEYAAAVKASIDDNEFEATAGSGSLKTIGVYTAALDGGKPDVTHQKPCGVSSVTLAETGGAAQSLGAEIRNVKIEFPYLSDDDDSLLRFRTHAVGIDIAYDWLQSDAANLINLSSQVDAEIDAVITMRSGLVITLSNAVGIDTEYVVTGTFQNKKVVRFTHTGQVLKTAIDGIFS